MTVATRLSGISKLASMVRVENVINVTDAIGNEFSVDLVHECTDCMSWLVRWVEDGVNMAGQIDLDKSCDADEGRIWFECASVDRILRHNEWAGETMLTFETRESDAGIRWAKFKTVEVAND